MRSTEATLTTHDGNSISALPLKFIDLGILAVVFLAPLFMGGRGPVGKFVFVGIVCLAAVAWAVAQCRQTNGYWRRSGVEWLLLASIALVTFQIIPLPQWILASLSPSISELLPLWSADGSATTRLGEWSTISLTPGATQGALVILIGYILLFLLVVQRIQTMKDIECILRWIAMGTIAMAALGLVQFLVGNGKFLWIFDHPSRDTFGSVKGAFHNQNHFAQFLALGIGPLIWVWIKAPAKSLQKNLFGISIGLVLVAGLLTFSRGGVIAIAVASIGTVSIFVWKSLLDKKAMVMAGIMSVIVAGALLIHGYEPLSNKFSALGNSRSIQEASHGRAALWSALLDGIPQFAWVGSGIGSHHDVYPLFMEEFYDVEFTHGENGFLPLALEGGIPALLLMLIGIGICFWWCFRVLFGPASSIFGYATDDSSPSKRSGPKASERVRNAACAGAILPGLMASVVHSFGDFVWYISACMSITVLLIACICRLHQLTRPQVVEARDNDSTAQPDLRYSVSFSRTAWIGITIIMVIGGGVMIHNRHYSALAAPHRYAYERISSSAYDETMPDESAERELLFEMANNLGQALSRNPDDPRSNLQFAAACLRRFELEQRHAINPMPLQQIRDAALASQFASKEEQNSWLDRAIGENMKLLHLALVHCQRAVRNGPLQGEGYVYLAELSFLLGSSADAKDAYIDQAYRVRPHSGVVAFARGQERALVNDFEGALKHWHVAFQHDPRIRSLIIEKFAPNMLAEDFLKHFQPGVDGLRQLQRNYVRVGNTADAQAIARQLADKLVEQARSATGSVAAIAWNEAQGMYTFVQDSTTALKCAKHAVKFEPNSVSFRHALGRLLLHNEDYEAATRELQWCLRRKPGDPRLVQLLTAANRGSLEKRSASSTSLSPAGKRFK